MECFEIFWKPALRESVRNPSFSGSFSVQVPENTDQKNSEYGHFSRIG